MEYYHLEHNFGHGQQHLAALLLGLNLLAFLLHMALTLIHRLVSTAQPKSSPNAAYGSIPNPILCQNSRTVDAAGKTVRLTRTN